MRRFFCDWLLRLVLFVYVLITPFAESGVYGQEARMSGRIFLEGGLDYHSVNENPTFRSGDVTLLFTFRYKRVEALAEPALVLYPATDNYHFYSDRFYVGYRFHQLFILRLGRFRTPLGYFTGKYFHAVNLMTPILRPSVVEFEERGGPLPIYSNGVEIGGESEFSDVGFGYTVDFVNGNFQVGISEAVDLDKYKTVIGKVYVKPSMFSEIGVSVGYDPFEFQSGGTLMKNLILGTNLVYDRLGGMELIVEGYLLRELEGRKWGYGGFALFSYPVLKGEAVYEVRPYLMVGALGWEEGNQWFEAVRWAGEEGWVGESGGSYLYPGQYQYMGHISVGAGARIGVTPEVGVKFGFEYRILMEEEEKNPWFVGVSIGLNLPLFLF